MNTTVNFETIPAELKSLKQWVCWRKEVRDGKPTKVPYQTNGKLASATDPNTWATFEAVCKVVGKFTGIGFVFTAEAGYTGIDLDHCVDTEGSIKPEALEIINELNSYSEYSQSGEGSHIITKAKLSVPGRKDGDYEMYSASRYFCMTGNHLEGTPLTIESRQTETLAVYNRLFPPKTQIEHRGNGHNEPSSLADTELLSKAFQSANGGDFQRLWDGNISAYDNDESRAELALCTMLAFWTGNDYSRIDSLFRQSGLMRDKWNRADYRERTIKKAIASTSETYKPHRTIINATNKPTTDTPEATHLTDMGNGERLARKYQGIIRYCFDNSQWLIWTGSKLEWDTSGHIKTLAKKTTRAIYNEAAEATSDEQAEKIAKYAHISEGEARLAAMIALAQSEPGIPVKISELNPDKWLINCLNGTVNLKTGNLQPHNAADLITLQVPTEYKPGADCPNWHSFLNMATGGDTALQSYLQKAVGYSLTGNTGAQVIFLIYGLGNNGKSTFCNTIRTLLDGYAARLDAEDLMLADRHNRGQAKEGLADIQGKRFVVGSELQDGRQLNTSLVKDISGQDSIKARRLYAHEVEFTPECKLWLYGNHKPQVRDTTISIWRRIKLIPFTATIADAERIDDYLEIYLLPELPGILAWAVKGCLLWQKEGLKDTEVVKSATASYRADEDALGEFLADCCILEAGATIAKKDLKALYTKWLEDNKADALNQKNFKARVLEKGITEGQSSDGSKRIWKGIRAKTPTDITDVSDKTDKKLCLTDKTTPILPQLPLENATRIETYGKNQSDLSDLSENAGELPDCPSCGCNEWTFSPDGKWRLCPCGNRIEGG